MVRQDQRKRRTGDFTASAARQVPPHWGGGLETSRRFAGGPGRPGGIRLGTKMPGPPSRRGHPAHVQSLVAKTSLAPTGFPALPSKQRELVRHVFPRLHARRVIRSVRTPPDLPPPASGQLLGFPVSPRLTPRSWAFYPVPCHLRPLETLTPDTGHGVSLRLRLVVHVHFLIVHGTEHPE